MPAKIVSHFFSFGACGWRQWEKFQTPFGRFQKQKREPLDCGPSVLCTCKAGIVRFFRLSCDLNHARGKHIAGKVGSCFVSENVQGWVAGDNIAVS
jgi:hypothetical protein